MRTLPSEDVRFDAPPKSDAVPLLTSVRQNLPFAAGNIFLLIKVIIVSKPVFQGLFRVGTVAAWRLATDGLFVPAAGAQAS